MNDSRCHTKWRINYVHSPSTLEDTNHRFVEFSAHTSVKEGYFPHLFNIKQNQNYEGASPEARSYSPDSMRPVVREKFLTWYEDNKNKTFNFQEEMVTYCTYITVI
ncbi:hypothetical protein CDAR_410201 [Caerostris darwini]|uniref:DNA-directed DNA polymerase n=1 Tax=Caerostris darwini TaxID=1538125 RepID=A0AAV4VX32_9ARAC|nr:hypothetical protein CDAR_410201 [Caerostris darwini]